MKSLILIPIYFFSLNLSAYDRDVRRECRSSKNPETCRKAHYSAVASGVATTAGSAIFSGSNFYKRHNIRKEGLVVQLNRPTSSVNLSHMEHLSSRQQSNLTRMIKEGAEVYVQYYLTPKENKQLHVKEQRSHIRYLHSEAARLDSAAMSALTDTVPKYNSEGKIIGYEPDPSRFMRMAMYQAQASEMRAKIPGAELELERILVADPSELSLKPQEKMLSARGNGAPGVRSFLEARARRGHKVFGFSRIIAEAVKEGAKKGRKGILWGGAGIIAGGATAYEVFSKKAGKTVGNDDKLSEYFQEYQSEQ